MTNPAWRTCLGCRIKKPRAELYRLTLAGGELPCLAWDVDRKASGRGGWLCPNDACLQKARRKKGVWARAFRLEGGLDLSALDSPPWPDIL